MHHGLVVNHFAGRFRSFRLAVTGHVALELATGDDPWKVFERLRGGAFRLTDVWHVLRVGLVGAGMNPAQAETLMERQSIGSLIAARHTATSVLLAAFLVPEGDEEEAKRPKSDTDEKLTLGTIYRNAFAIGIKPREADLMTLWEYSQCVGGWTFMHGGEQDDAPTQDEMAKLMAKYG